MAAASQGSNQSAHQGLQDATLAAALTAYDRYLRQGELQIYCDLHMKVSRRKQVGQSLLGCPAILHADVQARNDGNSFSAA